MEKLKLAVFVNDRPMSCFCGYARFLVSEIKYVLECAKCHRMYTKKFMEDSPTQKLAEVK